MVVVSREAINRMSPVAIVVPLTTFRGPRLFPSDVLVRSGEAGLPDGFVAVGLQVRVLSMLRLGRPLGSLSEGTMAALEESLDQPGAWAVTSGITLLEVLVVPFRRGDEDLAERYQALLTHSQGLSLRDLDRPLLRTATRLRAAFGVKTPDALQVAEVP